MSRIRHTLAVLALAFTAGCELLVRIDPNAVETGGGGAGGGTTTSESTVTASTSTTSSSSTSTSSTTTTTTEMCMTAAECPPATGICVTSECDPTTHTCTMPFVPAGGMAAASAQTTGDCKDVVCDGAGNAGSAPDDSDPPTSKEECITYSCSDGMVVTTYNAIPCNENSGVVCGTPGGSKQGECVACNVSTDCGPNIICQLNHCVTSSCNDGVQDGMETDVDCGGPVCAPCDAGLKCATNTDCQSDICGPTMTCTAATCSDGVQNEGETGVDCGGDMCRPEGKLCGTGQGCAVDGDCQSLDCVAGICQAPNCHDGIQNEGETDVDCGGPVCDPEGKLCVATQKCKQDKDCQSGLGCETSQNVCIAQCSDQHQDGNETDTDCGGGTCPACPVGDKCRMDTDCTTSACDGKSLICDAMQCTDNRQDGNETDVDCGGMDACARCNTNQKCLVDMDCISVDGCLTGGNTCVNSCQDGHKDGNETDIDCGGTDTCARCPTSKGCLVDTDCVTGDGCLTGGNTCINTCQDGHKDGNETDIDCGGNDSCARCPVGEKCLGDTDCASGACDGNTLLCDANQCADNRQDGNETDTDCGGNDLCNRCAVGEKCLGDTDCASGACDGNTLLCDANQCADNRQDGNETDVDCGGTDGCNRCPNGEKCLADTDCTSSACDADSNLCVSNQCADHRQDGNETDTDCGGTDMCNRCAVAQKCLVDTDCASSACDADSNLCVANQCDDHQQDGNETDVDCGGPVCPKCVANSRCKKDSDCQSDACDANTNRCVADQCADARQDGNETDTDCGGTDACPRCPTGDTCLADTDCVSGDGCLTGGNTCVASCSDGHVDGNETAIDCGGSCPGCADGESCLVDGDCTSSACDADSHTCVASQCSDHQQDGNETDIDCGGTDLCNRCAVGQMCVVDTDCASSACDFVTGLCVASECSDGRKDGLETDIDCGGVDSCPRCATGDTCLLDTDCVSGDGCLTGGNTCVASCSDGHMDGNETGVDCGGTDSCARCPDGESCLVDGDCTSSACDATTHLCVASQCSDGQKDGNETDTDCGGTDSCQRCPTGDTCLVDTDCVSGDGCLTGGNTCVASCDDGHIDGNETGIDCGGTDLCNRCAVGVGCVVNGDCTSGACDIATGLCVATQCSDAQQDGNETDTDCGGTDACPRCPTGDTCLVDTDCVSGDGCLTGGNTCIAACQDGHIDGSETDVDCGGGTCPACPTGRTCVADTDCVSGDGCLTGGDTCIASCSDGHKDGNETDVDCGGSCSPCPSGDACMVPGDCVSDVCNSGTCK